MGWIMHATHRSGALDHDSGIEIETRKHLQDNGMQSHMRIGNREFDGAVPGTPSLGRLAQQHTNGFEAIPLATTRNASPWRRRALLEPSRT